MANLSFKNWQVDLLRVTAFYGQVPPATKDSWNSWWTKLVGVPPEKTTLRRRDDVLQEQGPFGGGELILAIQPGRIDWLLKASEEKEEGQELAADLLHLRPEALNKFYELALRWLRLDTCPPINRIALGCILLQAVQDRRSGYKKVATYVPSVKLDLESTDFLYQINRPRQSLSGLSELRINRLCKWSVALLARVSVSVSSPARDEKSVIGSVEGQGQYACRLELDINSSQEYKGEFSGERLSSIFNELVDYAKEIAEKGDIR